MFRNVVRLARFLGLALLLCFSPSQASHAQGAGVAEQSPEEVTNIGSAERELIGRLLEERSVDDFARCSSSRGVVLNEVCSVGTECAEDVRVSDFVEVYNPSGGEVELGCFVAVARDRVPFVLSGSLEGGALRAWGEAELGFRISKDGDRVVLYRLSVDSEGRPRLVEREFVVITEEHALHFRVPDGSRWQTLSAADAELTISASFGQPNPRPAPAP